MISYTGGGCIVVNAEEAHHDKYLEMKVQFPENPAGTALLGEYYPIAFRIPNSIEFELGDKLVYDVYMSRNAGGFGCIDLINGGLNLHDSGAVDQNGISAHPTADVSIYAAEQWYTREIVLPDTLLLDFDGLGLSYSFDVLCPVQLPYDAALLAGETIIVKFDNIRITNSAGQEKYSIFMGDETVIGGLLSPNLCGFSDVQYELYTVDLTSDDPLQPCNPSGDVLKIEMDVEDGAVGEVLYYNEAFTIPSTFAFQSGDKLVYDVILNNDVAGLGGLDLYVGDAPGVSLRDTGCKDQNNVPSHPAADISDFAYQQWVSREITVSDNFVNASDGKDVTLLVAVDGLDASSVAGHSISARYDNIRIVRDGETVYTVFSDRSNPLGQNPIYYLNLNGSNRKVDTTLSVELDAIPTDGSPERFDVSDSVLEIEDTVSLGFIIDEQRLNGSNNYALITKHYSDGRADVTVRMDQSQWTVHGDGFYCASIDTIAASEMSDTIEAVFYNDENQAITFPYLVSVKDCAMQMLSDADVLADGWARTFFVDMLNYGAASQETYSYNTTSLANDFLTEKLQSYASPNVDAEACQVIGPGYVDTYLDFKSEIEMGFAFNDDILGTDLSAMYAEISYVDHWGQQNKVVIPGSDFATSQSNCHDVMVGAIEPADYKQLITCSVYDKDGNEIAYVKDSVESYLARSEMHDDVIKQAVLKYCKSYYEYYHHAQQASVQSIGICFTEGYHTNNSVEALRKRYDDYVEMGLKTLRHETQWTSTEKEEWVLSEDSTNTLTLAIEAGLRLKLISPTIMMPQPWVKDDPDSAMVSFDGTKAINTLSYWYEGTYEYTEDAINGQLKEYERLGILENVDALVVDFGPAGEPLYPAAWTQSGDLENPENAQTKMWCYGDNAVQDFRDSMLEKYGSVEAINDAWDTSFASMDVYQMPNIGTVMGRQWEDILTWYLESKREFIEKQIQIFQEAVDTYSDGRIRLILYMPGASFSEAEWDECIKTGTATYAMLIGSENEFMVQMADKYNCLLQFTGIPGVDSLKQVRQWMYENDYGYIPVYGENYADYVSSCEPEALYQIIEDFNLAGIDYTFTKFLYEDDCLTPSEIYPKMALALPKIDAFINLTDFSDTPYLLTAPEPTPEGDILSMRVQLDSTCEDQLALIACQIGLLGYQIQEGDVLEYDVKLSVPSNGFGFVDGAVTSVGNLRDMIYCTDQYGIGAAATESLAVQAGGKWMHRILGIDVPYCSYNTAMNTTGKTLQNLLLIAQPSKLNGSFAYNDVTVYYDNIMITNNGKVKLVIFCDQEDLQMSTVVAQENAISVDVQVGTYSE